MTSSFDNEVIAIVGYAGRFPGAHDIDGFWQMLQAGHEPLSHLGDAELREMGVPEDLINHPNAVKAAMILDGAEDFDPAFFGYTPGQATVIDPQQRIFLEVAWEALERAGCDTERFDGAVGVYASSTAPTFRPPAKERVGVADSFQAAIDQGQDFLPTRLSYKLNLRGPSVAVQTACSSSLVAVHLACQGLLNFECDLALAGGVSITFPQLGYLYQKGHIVSPDGRCRAYDADAQGVMPGRGAGVVALKRLADAIADGDHICAVIRGSAINNDGNRKVGYTAPAVTGQVEVLSAAHAVAGVDAATIGMVEGHGTGTALGDAIELAALAEVFVDASPSSCALGSLKTNIGHLDAAAGVAGLIKAALCVEHGVLAPSLHFNSPNAALAAPDSPFTVPTELKAWPEAPYPRRAGVSAFGIGGTNAHVVLEQAPETISPAVEGAYVFPLSARNPEDLERAGENLAAWLEAHPDADLGRIATTLQLGRKAFRCRRAVVTSDRVELISALRSADRAEVRDLDRDGAPLAFAFDGGLALLGSDFDAFLAHDHRAPETLAEVLAESAAAAEAWTTAGYVDGVGSPTDPGALQKAGLIAEQVVARYWRAAGAPCDGVGGGGLGVLSAAVFEQRITLDAALELLETPEAKERAQRIELSSPADLRPLARPGLALRRGATPESWECYGAPEDLAALRAAAAAMTEDSRPRHARPAETVLTDASLDAHLVGWRGDLAGRALECVVLPFHHDPLILNIGDLASGVSDDFDGAAVQNRLLTRLARLWMSGISVDWKRNLGARAGLRSPLPTYPFNRMSLCTDQVRPHFAPRGEATPVATPSGSDATLASPATLQTYVPRWVSAAPVRTSAADDDAVAWLVVSSGAAGEPVAARLRQRAATVVEAKLGRGAVAAALAQITPAPGKPIRVLVVAEAADTRVSFAEAVIEEVLKPAIAWSEGHDVSVTYMTQGLYELGDGAVSSDCDPLPLLLLAAGQEYQGLTATVVDLPGGAPASDLAVRYLDWAIGDTAASTGAPFVAYRGGLRFVREFKLVECVPADRSPFSPGDVHLITGGFGQLGLALAERLAANHEGRVVLVGRRIPESLAAGPADGDGLRGVTLPNGRKAYGVQVDLADGEAFAGAVDRVERELGQVSAVYHLAADLRHPSHKRRIGQSERGDIQAQLAAKVRGFEAIESAFAGRTPRLRIAFSSAAALLGGLGKGFYGASNLCLDQRVAQANLTSAAGATPWMTLNWDGWAQPGADGEAHAALGGQAIAIAAGLDALESLILAPPATQVAVIMGDLGQRLDRWVGRREARPRPAPAPNRIDDDAGSELERAVNEIWCEALGLDVVGADQNFFDIGGDSLVGVRILDRLEDLLGLELELSSVLDAGATVRSLSLHIAGILTADAETETEERELEGA